MLISWFGWNDFIIVFLIYAFTRIAICKPIDFNAICSNNVLSMKGKLVAFLIDGSLPLLVAGFSIAFVNANVTKMAG